MANGHTSVQMALRDPDIRLMLRVRDDDDNTAFTQLVENFQHRLVAVLGHLIGSSEEAEDLAQEVFLRVYRTRKRYTPKAKFSTWLFTIANNLALNALRNRKRRPAVQLDVDESGPLGSRPAEQLVRSREQSASGSLQQAELAARIHKAMETLNERQKMAVVLNKFEDMGYAEIADVMNLTAKAIKSLLSRARARLREALQDYVHMDEQSIPPESESHS